MHANAAAAYAKVSTTVLGPRSIEQKVFRQITGLLSAANEGENVPMSRIADAVYRNSQLWTLLAADVPPPTAVSGPLDRPDTQPIFQPEQTWAKLTIGPTLTPAVSLRSDD